jgi:Septum formation
MRYRRAARVAAVLGLAALLAVAGCGRPTGVDGDLTDDWNPIAAPSALTPVEGACHLASFTETGTRDTYDETDCAQRHRTETVYVGAYQGAAAQADAPPPDGSAGARAAYHDCDVRTTAYVGAPWRTARLWIGVTHPSAAAWAGGARWYRCEVLEVSSIEDDGGLVQRAGSLKNALTPGSPLLLTCYAVKLDGNGSIKTMPAAPCTAAHNAEFVGVWDAGTLPYPRKDSQWAAFHTGCRRIIAAYAAVPDDADLEFRTGVVSLPGGADVWTQGDHAVRCYAWIDGAILTSSIKGKGVKALPVQYK